MSTNKKFLYLVGKFISIIFAFLITKVPDYILENNFFDSGLAGYDLILYAFLCAAWIIFLLFVAIQVTRTVKFLLEK
jgi:hypothetical protein